MRVEVGGVMGEGRGTCGEDYMGARGSMCGYRRRDQSVKKQIAQERGNSKNEPISGEEKGKRCNHVVGQRRGRGRGRGG